jgi:hypothetical protein
MQVVKFCMIDSNVTLLHKSHTQILYIYVFKKFVNYEMKYCNVCKFLIMIFMVWLLNNETYETFFLSLNTLQAISFKPVPLDTYTVLHVFLPYLEVSLKIVLWKPF